MSELPASEQERDRIEVIEDGFQKPKFIRLNGFKMRTINVSLIKNAEALGITFLQGRIAELDRDQMIDQLTTMAWFQNADLEPDVVLDHLDQGTWKREVAKFQVELPLEVVRDLFRISRELIAMADKAIFELQASEKLEELDLEDPPGN